MATDRLDFAQTRRPSDEFISEKPVGASSLRQNRAVLARSRRAKDPAESIGVSRAPRKTAFYALG